MEEFQQSCEDVLTKVETLKKVIEKANLFDKSQFESNNPAQNSSSDSFIPKNLFYTSSKEDQLAVDLICKNIAEVSTICAENGFNLSIQQEGDYGMTVQLVQSSATFSSRKAFKELDDLVKRKSERDDEMESRFQKLVDNLREELHLKWKEDSEETFKKTLDEQKKLIEEQNVKIKDMSQQISSQKKVSNKLSIDRFLDERNLKTIRESPELLEKICITLSEEVENVDHKPPLIGIATMEEKKKIVIEYLDLLQTQSAKCTEMQNDISSWFLENWRNYLHHPTEEEKKEAANRMKQMFQLDNVVGTIHSLLYTYDSLPFVSHYAIVDKKVAFLANNEARGTTLTEIYENLKETFGTNYKFAIPRCDIDDIHADMFVSIQNKDVFMENEKVITWMNNNFECLSYELIHGIADDFLFAALYNMSLKYIQEPKKCYVCLFQHFRDILF